MRRFAFCFIFFLSPLLHTWADEKKLTLEERIPRELIERNDKFMTLTFENDLFANKDANYTNGTLLTYLDTELKVPTVIARALKKMPLMTINALSSVYYSIGQNLYTPDRITTRKPDPNDRPYAGFLYGSVGIHTIKENHAETFELNLGVVGPSALGEPTQEIVHDIVDAQDPAGWDAQLKDEPALVLGYQRQWPEFLSDEVGPFTWRLSPHIGGTLGNVYTYGATGAVLQLTPTSYKWQATPLRVRPAIPGSGYFAVPEKTFAWSIFAGVEGRAMVRNIFLDGNSYKDSPSVDKRVFVGDVNTGLSLTYGRIQTSFTLNYRSREFKGGSDATFGALSVGYRF